MFFLKNIINPSPSRGGVDDILLDFPKNFMIFLGLSMIFQGYALKYHAIAAAERIISGLSPEIMR